MSSRGVKTFSTFGRSKQIVWQVNASIVCVCACKVPVRNIVYLICLLCKAGNSQNGHKELVLNIRIVRCVVLICQESKDQDLKWRTNVGGASGFATPQTDWPAVSNVVKLAKAPSFLLGPGGWSRLFTGSEGTRHVSVASPLPFTTHKLATSNLCLADFKTAQPLILACSKYDKRQVWQSFKHNVFKTSNFYIFCWIFNIYWL